MTLRTLASSLLALLVSLCLAEVSQAGDGFLGRMLEFYRNRPYPVDHFAPGNYGYNLDDQSRGYFGGSRYTEYYAYGRGGGFNNLANFPSAPPGPAWLYDNRNWVGNQPVRPFAYLNTGNLGAARGTLNGTALLTVQVPEQAMVWLEDHPMRQTGPVREYVSPKLDPGVTYTYTIRARWHDGRQELDQVQHVQVQAGQNRQVNFMGAVPAPAMPEPGQPRRLPTGFGE